MIKLAAWKWGWGRFGPPDMPFVVGWLIDGGAVIDEASGLIYAGPWSWWSAATREMNS